MVLGPEFGKSADTFFYLTFQCVDNSAAKPQQLFSSPKIPPLWNTLYSLHWYVSTMLDPYRGYATVTDSSLADIPLTWWAVKLICVHVIYFANLPNADTTLTYSIFMNEAAEKGLMSQPPFIKLQTVSTIYSTFSGPFYHSQHNVLQLHVRVQEPTLWWAGQPLRLLLSEWGDVHINSS